MSADDGAALRRYQGRPSQVAGRPACSSVAYHSRISAKSCPCTAWAPAAVGAVLDSVRSELVRRMRVAPGDQAAAHDVAGPAPEDGGTTAPELPATVLVVEELAERADAGLLGELLDAVGFDGPENGVYVVAATTRSEILDDDVLAHFGTRLVLQLPDVDRSIQRLGTENAAELASGGALLLRIDGRDPVGLRGFRVSDARLDQLIAVLREAYGVPVRADAVTGRVPADVVPPAPPSAEVQPVVQPPPDSANGAIGAERSSRYPNTEPVVWSRAPLDEHGQGDRLASDSQQPRPAWVSAVASRSTVAVAPHGDTVSGQLGCTARPASAVGAAPIEESSEEPAEGPSTAIRAWLDGLPGALAAGAADVGATGDRNEVGEAADAWDRAGGDAADRPTLPHAVSADTSALPTTDAAPGGPVLQVRCFGRLRVFHGEPELTPKGEDVRRHRPWEALAYLAARPDGCALREKMLYDLWPTVADSAAASTRLHTCAFRFRGEPGDPPPPEGLLADAAVVRAAAMAAHFGVGDV